MVKEDGSSDSFPLTRWDLVAEVNLGDSSVRERATAELCRIYWYPVYAFVRRKGHSPHDAEDVTQELFARLIGQKSFGMACREKGKLRTYLLTAATRLLTERWRRERADKRGGRAVILSIEAELAEGRYASEPQTTESPESVFDRRWAYALLGEVEKQLAEEYLRKGKGALFEHLKPGLSGQGGTELSYAEIAGLLEMSVANVKVQMLRLRGRFRDLVRQEVAGTVASEVDVDVELQHLLAALRG